MPISKFCLLKILAYIEKISAIIGGGILFTPRRKINVMFLLRFFETLCIWNSVEVYFSGRQSWFTIVYGFQPGLTSNSYLWWTHRALRWGDLPKVTPLEVEPGSQPQWDLCLEQWFSTGGHFAKKNYTVSEDIFGRQARRKVLHAHTAFLHLVFKGRGCCQTAYNSQNSSPTW